MVYAVTGHRPEKIGGYGKEAKVHLEQFAIETLRKIKPQATRIFTGMALGWDQAIADACIRLNIPFVAAVPFPGQEMVWFEEMRVHYCYLLGKAQIVQMVSPGPYSKEKMQIRNQFIVNECEALIALWNGTTGGTCNCVKYAQEEQKKVINVWDKWVTFLSIKEKEYGDKRRLRIEEKRKGQGHI